MVPEYQKPHRLGLTEAYHVVNRWLSHLGSPPQSISEPVDGVVEMGGRGFHARIRIDATPIPQGGVLAMLRSVEADDERRLLLFSVTGFTNGAQVFANAQSVAVYELTADGDVVPRNSLAKTILPTEPLEPAFADPDLVDPEPELEPEPLPTEHLEPVSWRDCPRCGATHHPRANFCASCGADLHSRIAVLGTETPAERLLSTKQRDQRTAAAQPTPVRESVASGHSLRCRTCGSDDIELIRNS